MTAEMWYALFILGGAIILFITEWLRVDVVAIGVMVALMLTGLLSPPAALAGFSNSAVLTIGALFVVGGGIMHTGLAGLIGRRILNIAGNSEVRLIVVIMVAVAMLSGFMSDTGTVAVLLPAIVMLARSANISPSKLLIPLSFGSLLGGATTLIGTPPNLIVSDLLRQENLAPFGFFDYTPIGLLLMMGGILFMVFIGRHLLPDNSPKKDLQRVETPDELKELYALPESLFRLRVRRGSKMIGKTIATTNLRSEFQINLLRIERPNVPRPVVKFGQQKLIWQAEGVTVITPTSETVVGVDDILIVQGEGNNVGHAAALWNLGIQPAEAEDAQGLVTNEVGLAEILLPPRSDLLGQTLPETRFGTLYYLTVLGINRPGAKSKLDLKDTVLQFGDTLLVQGAWQHILALKKKRRDFVVMGQPEAMIEGQNRSKAPIALLILMGMLALMITGMQPVATASMLGALLMVLLGCLDIDEAYQAIDWKSLILIAGMIPMSTALEEVGLVNLVATGLTNTLGNLSPLWVMATLFLLTAFFTQVLSNTATTVLVAPIAFTTAQTLNINPHAFLMAVAIAASMAFASPVASPVNTLVMAGGNYRFSDYIKVGVPMILLMLVITLLTLPILWPF